ncbi:MAG: hypothetical protein NT069_03470 [Planctomycetota bacterium]|nr:hypothetical protein [Planctomycetota bacterium]
MSSNFDPVAILEVALSSMFIALSLTAAAVCWRYRRLSRWTLLLLFACIWSVTRSTLILVVDISRLAPVEFLDEPSDRFLSGLAFVLSVPETLLLAGGVMALLNQLVPRLFDQRGGSTPRWADSTSETPRQEWGQ